MVEGTNKAGSRYTKEINTQALGSVRLKLLSGSMSSGLWMLTANRLANQAERHNRKQSHMTVECESTSGLEVLGPLAKSLGPSDLGRHLLTLARLAVNSTHSNSSPIRCRNSST